jgi:hypothetical protein
MRRWGAVMVVALLLLAGCDEGAKPGGSGSNKPKGPSAAVVQVCGQVNRGTEVPSPLPVGLPMALQQSVREYQASYGKGDNSGVVGRIRTQCRKEGVAL